MATKVITTTVNAKAVIPTPIYNHVTFTVKIPAAEVNGLRIYDADSTNTDFFSMDPGDNIAITITNGEQFFWEGDGGACNVELIGQGW